MLVDQNLCVNPVCSIIAKLNQNSSVAERLQEGVYLLGHFSLDHVLPFRPTFDQQYPALGRIIKVFDKKIGLFSSYGVCDYYKQVLRKCPMIQKSKRKFIMSVTPIEKSNRGWRWHKWGPYIGTQKPTCEYLYDEPVIEKVFCYNIIEII